MHEVTDLDVARIAQRASVDRRSVIRKLAGLPVKGLAGARIDAALAEFRSTQTSARAEGP